MTVPIAKRADQLGVGDQIPDEHLAFRFNQGPAVVVFLALEDVSTLPWVFVAYRYPNGQHDSMTIRPEAVLQVFPADTGLDYSRADDGESPQPSTGRVPAHHEDARTGEVVMVGGHAAVAKVFACTAHGIHPHPGNGDELMTCLDCPQCRPPVSV